MAKVKAKPRVRAKIQEDVHELPQELLDEIPKAEEVTDERELANLSTVLVKRLEEAVTYRTGESIEDVWTACEEQYNGIDDMNRHEFNGLKWIKPTVMNAPVTTAGGAPGQEGRSSVFVRLSSRYVDSAAAKVGEILLPNDDKAFSFTSTPVPTLTEGLHDETPVVENGQPLMRNMKKEELPSDFNPVNPDGSPNQTPQVPLTTKDLVLEAIDKAEEKAKKAERRIYDWLVESMYSREMRKVIHDAARIGVGVVKGPYPASRRQMALSQQKDGAASTATPRFVLQVNEEIVPEVGWRDPWNIFPDPACGEYIQDGEYVFERDFASKRDVRKMLKLPGYMKKQIQKVLEIEPAKSTSSTTRFKGLNPADKDTKTRHQYEVWYYTGTISRAELKSTNPKAEADLSSREARKGLEKADEVFALVTIIEDIVVRATLNPLESGELNYLNIPWTRRSGYWAGVGVTEQIRVPQRIVNASTRAMLNNAGVSSGAQICIDQAAVKPADGRWQLTPNKIWYKSPDGQTDDVRKAFVSFNIESHVEDLMAIIEYGMRLAEESTNIPLITQGMSGKTTPETLGATQLQHNNANQLLRHIGYSFDDCITTRLIKMLYEWLLLDPEVPEDEKGDFKIHSQGTAAMVERAIQDQTIAQMTTLAENPIFGVDPKKWFAQLAKSRKLNPKDFQYTPEEQAKIDSQPKEPAPAIAVAQIKAQIEQMKLQAAQQIAQQDAQLELQIAQLEAETKKAVEQMRNETQQIKTKMDTDRDTVYVQAQTEKIRTDYDGKMQEIAMKKELLAMEMAANHQITVEQAKTKLADTAMKLKVQKELSAAELAADIHMNREASTKDAVKPPVQTPGRAKAGKSFSQS